MRATQVKLIDKTDQSIYQRTSYRDDLLKRILVHEKIGSLIRFLPAEVNEEHFEDILYDANDLVREQFQTAIKTFYPIALKLKPMFFFTCKV